MICVTYSSEPVQELAGLESLVGLAGASTSRCETHVSLFGLSLLFFASKFELGVLLWAWQ